nr:T9SS type A sorting domain-containing protein [Gammaproteobacteria bacterium]
STCGTQYWADVPPQTVNNRGAEIYEWPAGSGNFYGRDSEDSCIATSGMGDQFMNYMDYVYDDQMRMFSEGQVLEGYAWAAGRSWEQVANGVNVTLTSDVSYATTNDGFAVTVAFGETMTGFTESDLVVTNGSVTNFNGGDGSTYSFDVAAAADGEVTVDIIENSCVGATTGYANFASNTISIIVDRVGPVVGDIAITNLQDTQYITQNPNVSVSLDNFYDATSGVSLYYVAVGTSIGGEDVLAYTPYSGEQFNLNALSLSDYQQYFVSVYGQDLVGLNSATISASFYYFGTLLGDITGPLGNPDWKIDFYDYTAFMASYPGVDIAPVTGSAPYFFPNFDGVSDVQDLAMFESMWNWSIGEYGRTVPNYVAAAGKEPFLRVLNNQLIVKFPGETETAQVYFEYDPVKYNVDLLPSLGTNELILTTSGEEYDGSELIAYMQVELGEYGSNEDQTELYFSFENLTDSYEFLSISYSAYDQYNAIVSEGYKLQPTAPSSYRLSQSYPNPFTSGGTTIDFDMPATERISMVILDIRGRVVRTLIDNEERFGFQSIQWDAKNDDGDDVSSGVYFYQIRSSNFNAVGKLVFVK